MEELATAGGLLRIDLRVCSTIGKSYDASGTRDAIPQEAAAQIKDEVTLLLNYDSKLQEAKYAITRARNFAALAPATILPPEILARIFRLVLAGEECSKEEEYTEVKLSKYPERLSHVYSCWRQIAIGCRDLWTHIDLRTVFSTSSLFYALEHMLNDPANYLFLFISIAPSIHCFAVFLIHNLAHQVIPRPVPPNLSRLWRNALECSV